MPRLCWGRGDVHRPCRYNVAGGRAHIITCAQYWTTLRGAVGFCRRAAAGADRCRRRWVAGLVERSDLGIRGGTGTQNSRPRSPCMAVPSKLWADPGLGSMFPLGYESRDVEPGPRRVHQSSCRSEKSIGRRSSVRPPNPNRTARWIPAGSTQETVEGHAAQVLLESVNTRDMMVVGSHGHGGFVGRSSAPVATTSCPTHRALWWSSPPPSGRRKTKANPSG